MTLADYYLDGSRVPEPKPEAGDAARYLHIIKNPIADDAPLVFVRDGLRVRHIEIPPAARAALIESLEESTELCEVEFAYNRKSAPSYIEANKVGERLRFIDLNKRSVVIAILRALTLGYEAPTAWLWRMTPSQHFWK